jgi:formylglycine-generating enzyme required for sulfatase activity
VIRGARDPSLARSVRWLRAVGLSLALAALAAPSAASASPRVRHVAGLPLVRLPGGSFEPLYSTGAEPLALRVRPFLLMNRPVTNAEFLAFVERNPSYRRDRIARVFADAGYLMHWAAPREFGAAARPAQPVTRISWFAAKAFCESHGLRLPAEAEWELAAAASETRRDARRDPEFSKRLLSWYATPNRTLPDLPYGTANVYGVHDLHGVVWEWVVDFNNAVVVADSRKDGESVRDRFCGGGALLAGDKSDYAAFMRYAMRGSLEAHYTTDNLGFRCAADTHAGAQRR